VHDHLHDDLIDPLRTRPSRTEEPTDTAARAASAGRLDVLGPDGALGLQRLAGNNAVVQLLRDDESADEPSPVHDVVGSTGRPLEPDVRGDMEARLGADFGDVRIHDDSAASASASAVNAHAYTVGSNVVFQRDSYDPSSENGRLTLAHELTHVMQQRSGPVDGTETAGGIKVSDPGDRFEREASANAERVMASPTPSMESAPVQRHADGDAEHADEPEVQGLFVQRDSESPTEDEDEELPAG
jgi:hypothetical protein